MKKVVMLMVTVLLVAWLAAGCYGTIRGSGDLETREFDFSDFTRVEVGTAFEVEVVQSDSFSIRIIMDDNIFEYLDVSRSGETLEIRLKSGYGYVSYTSIIEITMPELHKLGFSGATSGMVSGFSSTQDLDVELSGASSLNILGMAAGDIDFKLSGASDLTGSITADGDARFNVSGASSVVLSGSADDLDADVSGASSLDLEDFPVGNASIGLSGASNGTVNLDGTLNADVSGASHLSYIGEPTLGDLETSGASSISRK
jgi:hypothetical protein